MRNAPAGYGWRLSTPFGGARAQRRARLCRRHRRLDGWMDGWMDGWNQEHTRISELRVLSTFLCRSIHKKRDSTYHLDGSRTVNVHSTRAHRKDFLGDCTFVFLSLFTHIKSTPRKTARIHHSSGGGARKSNASIDNPRVRFIHSFHSFVPSTTRVTSRGATSQRNTRAIDRSIG